MNIEGKVFIVTGGASGLGAGTVRMLVANGAKVVIADVQTELGEKIAAELGQQFVRCDVASEADGKAVVAAATATGKLMGLVNCAGIAPAVKTVGRDGAHPLDVFTKTIMVNLIGSFNMIRLAAEAMSANEPEPTGERGVLISTASVAAYDGQIGQAAYSASKGGLVGMTLPIARDLARNGIRCSPSLTRSACQPRKPPSFAAFAASCAASSNHSRTAAASSGVPFSETVWLTSRSSSRISTPALAPLLGLKPPSGLFR